MNVVEYELTLLQSKAPKSCIDGLTGDTEGNIPVVKGVPYL